MATATPKIIPTLRYRDAAKAIAWLCDAFGFGKHLVVPGEGGTIVHAQLTLGNGMIMLGSAREDDYSAQVKVPSDLDGNFTQAAYVIVADPDHVFARAKSAGAKITREIQDEEYGGRGFSCTDPEGHPWHFGSYDPWAEA